MRKCIVKQWEAWTLPPPVSVDTILRGVMKTITAKEKIMFVNLPGVNAPKWPDYVTRKFYSNWPYNGDTPWKDYIYLEISGTTFSGEPTTTLMNTIRSYAYVCYYIRRSGVSRNPWSDDTITIAVSGDDSCILCLPYAADRIARSAEQLSTRRPEG